MNGPIRRQILIPIVAIQSATIVAITAAAVGLAAWRDERQSAARLAGVIEVLERSTFPLTSQVLTRMHGLSEAHFVVQDAAGRAVAASDETLGAEAPGPRAAPGVRPADSRSWRQWPTTTVAGRTYFAARIPAPASSVGPGASLLVLYPESSWRAALWDVAAAPVALGLAAIALTAQATRWFADRIGRRVHRLREQVARIADGDFQEIEPGEDQDEVGDLIRSVNQMSRQLRDMRRTIAVAERTQLLAQLAAGFAHQLRNTLTGARLGVQLHARRTGAGEDSALAVAVRQLELAEEQVRGLLTLGRLEQRPHRPCELSALLRDVASLLDATTRHARVALEVETPDAPAVASVDEPSVRAAVLNLAWNGLEAAGPGGRVCFRLIADEDPIMIEVGDDGPGPPPDLAPGIFDPFVTGKPEGVGLGLALARRVAEVHRGTLGWRRNDGWTWFRLTLPRDEAETETSPAHESRPDRG
ncbi:sensor histidine kinase [Paludisphaera soli]|uniref:sensor histidine kinase n=1 Tax=Paludisphaera soli TaxID=2712865 RepID=UPI0013EB444D|nr:HAMP domain-containing sensor histidine kinase [Paludisphaera soli]